MEDFLGATKLDRRVQIGKYLLGLADLDMQESIIQPHTKRHDQNVGLER